MSQEPLKTAMTNPEVDSAFAGLIPQFYERYLVPLIFEPYAVQLVSCIARHMPSRVLEIAAGTGVVTRKLAQMLAPEVSILATDLNQPMLDHAALIGTHRSVEWYQADAMQLPFPNESFDVVVCQFGVMFFPDRSRAYAEARRVLRPGGRFIFNVWDQIEVNEFADIVTQALAVPFSEDPPRFLARVPHGYHDPIVITKDLMQAGFVQSPEITTLTKRSQAVSSRIPALAYCQGTPLRSEIELCGGLSLLQATDIVSKAIENKFGTGAVDGKIQAHIIVIQK